MEPGTAGMVSGVDGAKPKEADGTPDPLLGQLIRARYRVVGKVATGRMGTVYVAQQVSTGNRIALKVLHAELSRNEKFVSAFQQLMMAVRALSKNHRNIVKVYECNQTEDGNLFVAAELLEGTPLSDVIRQQSPLGIERALRLARQMAEGLGVAHEFGVVHADVRPQNFMVIGRDEAIKVFGFERARIDDVAPVDLLDPSGTTPRTSEYLAPEQIRGKEITKQTDIYAFGIVLYEMLTGVVPFRASTPEAVETMHLQDPPTPLKVLRAEIPAVVEAKVLQALAKEPKRRETYVSDVANEYLYESALFEMAEEKRQSNGGRLDRMTTALRTAAGQVQAIVTQGVGWGAGWKLAVISGLLIFMVAAWLWVIFSRRISEVARPPLPQPKPVEARGQGPVITDKPEAKAVETISSPPQAATPLETGAGQAVPQEPQERRAQREKKIPPAPRKERAKPRASAAAPPLAQSEGPAEKTEAQEPSEVDPGAVIDWLLKRPPTPKE